MGKLMALGMVWLLAFAIALILIDSQLSIQEPDQTSDGTQNQVPPDNGDSQASGLVALQVVGHLVDDFWERGINDLPILTGIVNYQVKNVGNITANAVTLAVLLNDVYYSTETLYNLLPNANFQDSLPFSVEYDQSTTIHIEARCENVTDSWSYTVDAELPRQPSWSLSKLFITPDEAHIEAAYREIMSDLPGYVIHWIAIRNWVGGNINYVSDAESSNMEEYWQLGKETLENKTGDCEDFAILLCSLLRADGWGTADVYVVIGKNEAGRNHAWVKIKIPLVGWYNIEPTQSGWYTGPGDILSLKEYKPVYNFNDQYFIIL